jgi:chromosome segregation ATPase
MNHEIVEESRALAVSMARLRAVVDRLDPETLDGAAATALFQRLDYFRIVHNDFVQLAKVEQERVSVGEARLQESLQACVAKETRAQQLESEAESKTARLDAREVDINAKASNLESEAKSWAARLDAREADVHAKETTLETEVKSRTAAFNARQAEIQSIESRLESRSAHLDTREADINVKESNLDSEAASRSAHLDAREADINVKESNLDSEAASRSAHLDAREAGINAKESNLESEASSRTARLEARESDVEFKLDARQSELNTRSAVLARQTVDVESRERDLENRETALGNLSSAVNDRVVDLETHETTFRARMDALVAREAGLETQEAASRAQMDVLDAREAELGRRLSDVASQETAARTMATQVDARDAALAGRLADLQTRETELEAVQQALGEERQGLDDDKVVLWRARNALANDMSALQELKNKLDKAQQDAVDRGTAADTRLAQRIDHLCAKLDSASIEAIEPRVATILESNSALGVKVEAMTASVQDIKGQVDTVSSKAATACSLLDIQQVQEAVETAGNTCEGHFKRLQSAIEAMHAGSSETEKVLAALGVATELITKAIQASGPGAQLGAESDSQLAASTLGTHPAPAQEPSRCHHGILEAENENLKSSLQALQTRLSDLEARLFGSQDTLASETDQGAGSRKRRRVDDPESQSEWARFVLTVADEMATLAPEEVQQGNPGAPTLFYELCLIFLKASYKTRCETFVQSGNTGVWHCLRSQLSGRGGVVSDGRCQQPPQGSCIRVMLRQDGPVVRTVFNTSPS